MAIQKAITESNYGMTFEQGYLKIAEVLVRPLRGDVRIDLRAYASAEAREKIREFDIKKEEFKALRKDPNSDDIEIRRLEDELGKKPIGIFKERMTIDFDEFASFCEGFSKDQIIAGSYLYVKSLDNYKDAIDI